MTARLIPGKLDLKFAGNYSYALGRDRDLEPQRRNGSTVYHTVANTDQVARPWPAFEDSLLRLEASLQYHFAKAWTASLNYAFESFRKHDWRTDSHQSVRPGRQRRSTSATT